MTVSSAGAAEVLGNGDREQQVPGTPPRGETPAAGRGGVPREERRAVSLSGWLIRDDGVTAPFHLHDLSYAGCRITTETRLDAGERIKLAVHQRGLVEAEVRWRRSGSAGLCFCDLDPAESSRWPRRTRRTPVHGTVRLKRWGRARYELPIFDVSVAGCKVEFADRPLVDEFVLVKLAGMEPLEAKVCWMDGCIGGLRFSKKLHPAVLALHLASYGRGAGGR